MDWKLIVAFWTSALAAACLNAGEPHEREVVFHGGDHATLTGTLLLPTQKAGQGSPALVLLPGSGPTDRNGNQPPALVTDLLKQLAEGLASQGIASLRFDKRGMYANAKELPKDKSQFGTFFSWENFATDARMAYEFLCEQPEIESRRVGLLGHSEGGVLALVAARELSQHSRIPAAVVLVSTPGRSLDRLIDEQLRALLKKQKATDEQTKFFMVENARITSAILRTGAVPNDVPAGLKVIYQAYLGGFLRSAFETDPCDLAANYPGPVLVVAGEKDVQVSVERDAQLLDEALKSRPHDDHEILVIPMASHNLKQVASDNEPGFAGDVSQMGLAKICDWSKAKLSASRPTSQ